MDLSKIKTSEEFLDAARREGATVSGGSAPPDFRQGWAHRITFKSRGMIAHYFTREPYTYDAPDVFSAVSACGLVGFHSKRVPLVLPGNMPFCARCENKLMRAAVVPI